MGSSRHRWRGCSTRRVSNWCGARRPPTPSIAGTCRCAHSRRSIAPAARSTHPFQSHAQLQCRRPARRSSRSVRWAAITAQHGTRSCAGRRGGPTFIYTDGRRPSSRRSDTSVSTWRRRGRSDAGVLPLVRVRSALFGHYLVSMPFVNYGGPLGEPPRSGRWRTQRLGAGADAVKLLELRSRGTADRPAGLPPKDHGGARSAGRAGRALAGPRIEAPESGQAAPEGRSHRAIRAGQDRAVLHRLRRTHARSRYAGDAARLLPSDRPRTSGTRPGSGARTIRAGRSRAAPVSAGALNSRSPGRPRSARTIASRPTCCSTGRSWSARCRPV